MKDFKTISELELSYYAYYAVLENLLKEQKRINENPDLIMPIAKHWIKIYTSQLQELNERILELEKINKDKK